MGLAFYNAARSTGPPTFRRRCQPFYVGLGQKTGSACHNRTPPYSQATPPSQLDRPAERFETTTPSQATWFLSCGPGKHGQKIVFQSIACQDIDSKRKFERHRLVRGIRQLDTETLIVWDTYNGHANVERFIQALRAAHEAALLQQ